jgi:hypothetical protein
VLLDINEVVGAFAQEGADIAIIDKEGSAYADSSGCTLDEIIVLDGKTIAQDEGQIVPDGLMSRLKMGGRVSVLMGEHQADTSPISSFHGRQQLRFLGLLRIGRCKEDIAAIARYRKVEGGNHDTWPRAGFVEELEFNDAGKLVPGWQAANNTKEFLELKPDSETYLPKTEYFLNALNGSAPGIKGTGYYVLRNAFKSIDVLTANAAAEQGHACAFFMSEGESSFTDSVITTRPESVVMRFECNLEIISVRFAKFLIEHLLKRSGINGVELFSSSTSKEFFDQIVVIPRKFAQEAMVSFIETYEVFRPFASSQTKLREQLSPLYPDYELLMRSACRLKQISIEHRWTALQQISYDLPSPVAHCISAFFTRDDAEHRGRVAGKLLDVAIELHALVAVSVATDSFMPQAQSTAAGALLKAEKATLGTWIDSTLSPIKSAYTRERDKLLAGGSDAGLSRLGPAGIYAMEGLFGEQTYLAIKEMQRVRNDEGQAHTGLGRESQSEFFAEQVINAFINYFEATRVLWSTLSLNYCRSLARDITGFSATFNQLSGSSYLLPNKQIAVPADFVFNPGQLALMPNRSLAESDKFAPIPVTPLYFVSPPQEYGPIFIYFFNQIVSHDGKTDYVFNNYSYIEDSRKTFAQEDSNIKLVSEFLAQNRQLRPAKTNPQG